ncbi:cytochrome c oxidase subunit 3 [Bradyrhizobium sp. CCBAU 53421]|uniref:cytochrome c oxidase subunit 3 n=1 Tax=Bradyrhizobium sp. CCBAU 53421 TaxID=1325120 RepID=UPI00188C1201|nr:cytochrome c oxidase subunit 3 [Bradyrhizobium sp. CCBAU 53421]QOZ32876.1 cytochrome c oxidase subunit 3 family protein [Bradyrhizobium sp. CCBAU 53421]
MRDLPAVAPQFASVGHRDETAELGMWVFIATEVLLFGGLLLAYFVYRHAYPQGFATGSRHTEIVIGTANTAILLTSSFLVAWAVEMFSAETRKLTAWLLAAAICLGLAFIALKGIEYHGEYEEHLVPGIDFEFKGDLANGVQLFFIFYFIATAIHALHMIIGIGLLAALALLCRNAPSSRHRAALHSAALYWHFVDIVWIFLFALIYLPGRSSS